MIYRVKDSGQQLNLYLMKKELLISAKFDTSDFDKSVERMQNRLKDLYAPADMVRAQTQTAAKMGQMGMGGIMSPSTNEATQRASVQTKRELDRFIVNEAREQEKLVKLTHERGKALKELEKDHRNLIKGSKEELDLQEKISKVKETSRNLDMQYKQRDAAIQEALEAKQRNRMDPRRLATAYQQGGIGGLTTAGGRMLQQSPPGAVMGGGLGMIGAGIGMAGGALGFGSEMYRAYGRMPVETTAATGSAISGTLGKDVQNVYGRRTAFEMPFMAERARAAQMAMEAQRTGKTADMGSIMASMMKWGGAGMSTGAGIGGGIGAGIGSLGLGVGALPVGAVGAGIGGAIGGLGGGITGLLRAAGDPRQRALMGSKLPFVGGRFQEQYNALTSQQMAGDYQKSYQSLKEQNPYKTAANAEYEQNYMRNLQAQRGMGLENEGFYGKGGFQSKNIAAGFTPEMGLEMAGQIQGAGGSTRMARESVFGNQMQRGMNMTNAGQVLGAISGGVGGAEATKQATISILAEGMKLGLDDSKFAEENRRFTMAAAEMISRSGASSDSDFQRNAKNFSSFMGDQTNKGIDAAKSAYEQYQQITSTTTGPRGVMRAAGFMKDKYLSQLSTIEKQAIMQIPEEQLNENNPLVAGLAEKSGTGVQDFVGRIRGVNQGSVSRFKEADQIRDRLKAKGIDVGKTGDPEYLKSLSTTDRADVTQLMAYQTTELGFQGSREMISRAAGTVGAPGQMGPGIGAEAVSARMGAGTGRMEDTTIAAMAGDASTVLKNFNEMRGGMNDAAKSAAAFTDQIRELNAQLQKALEDSRNGKGGNTVNDILQKIITTSNNSNQSQVNGKKKE